jgi:hypothetical protein
LLAWLYLSKIQTGYIVPSQQELEREMDSSNADFDVKTSISYAKYHKKFQKACIDCLNQKQSKFGSHTSRKMFYLFGRWFGPNLEALSRYACHKTFKNAQRYSRDAGKYIL